MAKINLNVDVGRGKLLRRIQVELPTFDHKQSRSDGKRIWSVWIQIGTQKLCAIQYSENEPTEYNAIYTVTPKNAPIVLSHEWTKHD